MVIDSSVVVSILLAEPGYIEFENAMDADSLRLISLASVLECTIVCARRKLPYPDLTVDRQLSRLKIYPISITPEQLAHARQAFLKYGKGMHPAALNFGDCFSYALSKTANEPLLFKGADFSQTDVISAL